MNKALLTAGLTASVLLLAACSPEVGSEKWCNTMDNKPKGEWTANEAGDYAKYCMLKLEKEKEE